MVPKEVIFLIFNIFLFASAYDITWDLSYIYINEGDELRIKSDSSVPEDIFYPKSIPGLVSTSSPEFSTEDLGGRTRYILKRSKAVFGDTGWYGFAKSSENTRKLNEKPIYVTPVYDEIEIQWTYVYVRSENHPLTAESDVEYVYANVGDDVTLPCRPTSPDFNLTLSPYSEAYDVGDVLPVDGKKVSYDPRYGFTIHKAKEGDGTYLCEANEKNYQSVLFHVSIQHPSKSALRIYSKTLQQLKLGKEFSMECTARSPTRLPADYAKLLSWKIPSGSTPAITFEETLEGKEYHYSSKLTINSAAATDVGLYQCYFYGGNVTQVATANLQFHATKHLEIVENESPITIINAVTGQNFKKTLTLSAYPYPTFKWVNPKKKEVTTNIWTASNYDLNGEEFSVDIVIPQVTSEDQGRHELTITNEAGSKTFDFFVNVLVKPSISTKLAKSEDALENSEVTASCEVEGKPQPKIYWSYGKTFNASEDDRIPSVLVKSTKNGDKLTSTIAFKVLKSGSLVCQACNEAGCQSQVVKVIHVPVTMEYGVGIKTAEGKHVWELILNEGDTLTIDCQKTGTKQFLYPDLKEKTSPAAINPTATKDILRFQRSKTVSSDSGWYGCADIVEEKFLKAGFPLTPYNYLGKVQWVYVFVQSTKSVFVETPWIHKDNEGKYQLYGELDGDVLLPCLPNSMNSIVKIDPVIEGMLTEFNPKRGMNIRYLEQSNPREFKCKVDKHAETRDFKINLPGGQHSLEKPIINFEYPTRAEIGKPYTMNCSAYLWTRKSYVLKWKTPESLKGHTEGETVQAIHLPETPIQSYKHVFSVLTIPKVTAENLGDYECHLHDYASVKKKSTRLTLLGQDHLQVSVPTGFSVDENMMKWFSVNVDAYPKPTIQWIGPKGNEMDAHSEYLNFEVNNEIFQVYFSGHTFTMEDAGVHTIVATNSKGQKVIPFTVNVYQTPSALLLTDKPEYIKNDVVKAECSVYELPNSKISWEFVDQNKNLAAQDSFKNKKTANEDGLTRFTTEFAVSASGELRCSASNEYNIVKASAQINVIEFVPQQPKDPKLEEVTTKTETKPDQVTEKPKEKKPEETSLKPAIPAAKPDNTTSNNTTKPEDENKDKNTDAYNLGSLEQSINVTVGSNITLNCSALIYKFPDAISWSKGSDRLKSGEKFAFNDTKGEILHHSHLTIKKFEKEDAGDYICEGKLANDTAKTNTFHLKVNSSAAITASVILQLSITLLFYLM